MKYVLAVHGGAGTIRRGADEAPYHAGMRAALEAGEAVLRQGGSALDAVTVAVAALEDFPLFNAGYGAVYTSAHAHELDAGVMDGSNLHAGAVASVRHVRNPILAARAVLQDNRYVLLSAQGADRFAQEAGLVTVANDYFSTPHRLAQLHEVQRQQPGRAVLDHSGLPASHSGSTPELDALVSNGKFGTVGAVALDQHGHLAAATSTGGMTNKHPGRVGDTPLVGSGVYANDATCAVSATGTGEQFIRACAAFDIHARMLYGGASLDAAAQATVHTSLAALGGQGGLIALGRDGTLAMPFNTPGMYRGWIGEGQASQTLVF